MAVSSSNILQFMKVILALIFVLESTEAHIMCRTCINFAPLFLYIMVLTLVDLFMKAQVVVYTRVSTNSSSVL